MRPYIFGERDGIHIIDLLQTEHLLAEARRFAAEVASKGGAILFVGTKKQARDAIKEWAERCEHAVRQPALARRAADQLPHDVGADRAPPRADRPARGGPARPAADQGADGARGRAGEARVQPRRRARDEAPAAGGADHRPEDRGDRGARGRAAADPDHRPGRLQRRPGADRLPGPRQRRLDPLLRAGDPDDRRGRLRGRPVLAQGRGRAPGRGGGPPPPSRRRSASAPRPRSAPARRPRRRRPPLRASRGARPRRAPEGAGEEAKA